MFTPTKGGGGGTSSPSSLVHKVNAGAVVLLSNLASSW